jgi:hypothetical protein
VAAAAFSKPKLFVASSHILLLINFPISKSFAFIVLTFKNWNLKVLLSSELMG